MSSRDRAETPNGSQHVAAIIVTFRRPTSLRETIASIVSQEPTPTIVVVDNDPDHEVHAGHPPLPVGVHVVASPGNLGFAGGLEAGMRYAKEHLDPDWFWLFDDDSPVTPGSLDRALQAASRLPEPRMLGNRGADLRGGRLRWIWAVEGPVPTTADFSLVDGAILDRAAVTRGGFPCGEYFMGFEDFEYSSRLRRNGVGIYLGSQVISSPGHLGSTGSGSSWRAYYQTRNHLHTAISQRSIRLLASWIDRTARQLAFQVRYRPPGWRRAVRMRVRGSVDGLLGRMGMRIKPD